MSPTSSRSSITCVAAGCNRQRHLHSCLKLFLLSAGFLVNTCQQLSTVVNSSWIAAMRSGCIVVTVATHFPFISYSLSSFLEWDARYDREQNVSCVICPHAPPNTSIGNLELKAKTERSTKYYLDSTGTVSTVILLRWRHLDKQESPAIAMAPSSQAPSPRSTHTRIHTATSQSRVTKAVVNVWGSNITSKDFWKYIDPVHP